MKETHQLRSTQQYRRAQMKAIEEKRIHKLRQRQLAVDRAYAERRASLIEGWAASDYEKQFLPAEGVTLREKHCKSSPRSFERRPAGVWNVLEYAGTEKSGEQRVAHSHGRLGDE